MQLTIRDIAFGGKGVGRVAESASHSDASPKNSGLVVFVPYVLPGETVTVALTRKKKNYAEANLVAVVEPSPDRVQPECPAFGRCGGCAYQHISYPAQLAIKTAQVEQTLRRVGKLADVPMRPAIPSPDPYGYRNRIRVHVAGSAVGFYANDGTTLLDIPHCPIAAAEVNERLAGLRAHRMPDGDYTLSGQRKKGFFEQTNYAVAEKMLQCVESLLDNADTAASKETGALVDAYCGAGFFAQHLRSRFAHVVGIEENAFAIAHARAQAEPHERYLEGDVADHLAAVLAELRDEPQIARATLLLDPPAAGVAPRVLDAILAFRPAELIYVSCNPGTLARDLAQLAAAYRLQSVTPLDMFPQTAEIEVVAHLKLV